MTILRPEPEIVVGDIEPKVEGGDINNVGTSMRFGRKLTLPPVSRPC